MDHDVIERCHTVCAAADPLKEINQLLYIASNLQSDDLLSMGESLFWIYCASRRTPSMEHGQTGAYRSVNTILRKAPIP
jgi:hypothetical protein